MYSDHDIVEAAAFLGLETCDNGRGETKSCSLCENVECHSEGEKWARIDGRIRAAEAALLEAYHAKWIAGGALTKLQGIIRFALDKQEDDNVPGSI